MQPRNLRVMILLTLFSLIGCQQSNTVHPPISSPSDVIPTSIFTPILFPTATFTSLPTITVTPSPKPTATITLTPLPTLSKDKVLAKFDQLYNYNNGCKLPCWWGITPGVTTVSDAQNFLMQFKEVGSIAENLAFFQIPSPGFNHPEGTRVYFKTQNGIVVAITLLSDLGGHMFDMHKLYTEYGNPDSVQVLLQDCSQDSGSCWAEVFYRYDEGFLSQTQVTGTIHDTTVSLCMPPWDYGVIYTWAPDVTINLIHYGKNKYDFISLDEANQKKISELFTTNEFFTKGYYSHDFEICFDVPQPYSDVK